MKAYTVAYKMYAEDEDRHISILATDKTDAYVEATYVEIPNKEKAAPYSAWVYSVTYQNGREHLFNTFEGKRF